MDDASFCSVDYYRGRERAERELADQTASVAIRNIHLEMADRYRELSQQDRRKRTGQDRHRLLFDDAIDLEGQQKRG